MSSTPDGLSGAVALVSPVRDCAIARAQPLFDPTTRARAARGIERRARFVMVWRGVPGEGSNVQGKVLDRIVSSPASGTWGEGPIAGWATRSGYSGIGYPSLPMIRRLLPLALLILPALSHAEPFSWVTWDPSTATANSVVGTIPTDRGLVTVTFSGVIRSVDTATEYWNPASSFEGGAVSNRPDTHNSVTLQSAGAYSLTFSRPVANVAVGLWSVGRSGTSVSFDFDQTPTIAASGPNNSYGGEGLIASGNAVRGQEANGTVLFNSVPSRLGWTTDIPEDYSVITVGLSTAQPVPEPATVAALGVGALALLRRRKR
ncbi:PEP-CTERM sorting domain-containing protein [bacterium]|nr:MAG: PEP-CTERM sorting domain-containing protein [bacterium]